MVIITLTVQGHLYPSHRTAPQINGCGHGPSLALAGHRLFLPGLSMKYVALPLAWFVLLSCVVGLASGLSLSLV
ncbi:hypothetical protein GKKCFE_12425 [Pseudomonas sp. E141]